MRDSERELLRRQRTCAGLLTVTHVITHTHKSHSVTHTLSHTVWTELVLDWKWTQLAAGRCAAGE